MADTKTKQKSDNKYSDKAQESINQTMKEFKAGKLKSSSGETVTDHGQAIAIAISEARRAGYKVPPEPDDDK